MLDHMQDVGVSRAPAKCKLHDNEWKPVRPVPKAEKADDSDADGCKAQFHLKAAVQGPADPRCDFICIKDMTKQAAHDCEPA